MGFAIIGIEGSAISRRVGKIKTISLADSFVVIFKS